MNSCLGIGFLPSCPTALGAYRCPVTSFRILARSSFNDSMRVLIAVPPARRAQTRRGATTCPRHVVAAATISAPADAMSDAPRVTRRTMSPSSGVERGDNRCGRACNVLSWRSSSDGADFVATDPKRGDLGSGAWTHSPPPSRAPKNCAGPGAAASPPPLRAILSARPYASRLNESRRP